MPLTPEQREVLNRRRQEVTRELQDLSANRPHLDYADHTEQRQELLDELEEIQRDLGEVEPEE